MKGNAIPLKTNGEEMCDGSWVTSFSLSWPLSSVFAIGHSPERQKESGKALSEELTTVQFLLLLLFLGMHPRAWHDFSNLGLWHSKHEISHVGSSS